MPHGLLLLCLNPEPKNSVRFFPTRGEITSQISCTLRPEENLHYNTDPNCKFLLYR